MDKLATYPFVIVRIGCAPCKRQGEYRLARLADKFGAETPLADVLKALTKDCPHTADTGRQICRQRCPLALERMLSPGGRGTESIISNETSTA
jgi:hypothetical protein